MNAAMTDGQFWLWTILACLTIAFGLALLAAGLAKAAGRPAPQRTLADRMEAARSWDPVAEAEDITKEAAR